MPVVVPGLYYTKEHEWVKQEGRKAYIGVTDYAQSQMGDVVYADGEPIGRRVDVGDTIGVLESVKAASDIYTPVSGVIVDVNAELASSPETVNAEPYDSWVVALEMDDESQLGDLMDAEGYEEYCRVLA